MNDWFFSIFSCDKTDVKFFKMIGKYWLWLNFPPRLAVTVSLAVQLYDGRLSFGPDVKSRNETDPVERDGRKQQVARLQFLQNKQVEAEETSEFMIAIFCSSSLGLEGVPAGRLNTPIESIYQILGIMICCRAAGAAEYAQTSARLLLQNLVCFVSGALFTL
jgi:hypothetical protein